MLSLVGRALGLVGRRMRRPASADIPAGAVVIYEDVVTGKVRATSTVSGDRAIEGAASGTPATTVVTETAFGQASAVGTGTKYSRDDHTHGTPAAPTSVSGNAGTATALQTPRAINGVNFDGTAPITVAASGATLTGTTLAAGLIGTTGTTACAGNDGRLSDARAPTGAAGGDLTGTYPNPTISTSIITAAARTVLDDATVAAMLATLGGVALSTYSAKGSILVATAAATPADHVAGADFASPMYDSTQTDGLANVPMIPWPSAYHFGMTSIGATTARNDTGALASASTGTASAITTAARRAIRYTSAASTGSAAEVHSNGYDVFRRDRGAFQVSFRFQTGSSLAVCRWFVGVFSGAPTNVDALGAVKAVGIRYSTPAADGGWMPISCDGSSAVTVGTQITTIAVSTDYLVDLEYDGTSTFRVRVNSGSWTNITATLPGTTVVMGSFVGVYTNENVAKVCDFSWMAFRAPA